jgi:hypothetical protein
MSFAELVASEELPETSSRHASFHRHSGDSMRCSGSGSGSGGVSRWRRRGQGKEPSNDGADANGVEMPA